MMPGNGRITLRFENGFGLSIFQMAGRDELEVWTIDFHEKYSNRIGDEPLELTHDRVVDLCFTLKGLLARALTEAEIAELVSKFE